MLKQLVASLLVLCLVANMGMGAPLRAPSMPVTSASLFAGQALSAPLVTAELFPEPAINQPRHLRILHALGARLQSLTLAGATAAALFVLHRWGGSLLPLIVITGVAATVSPGPENHAALSPRELERVQGLLQTHIAYRGRRPATQVLRAAWAIIFAAEELNEATISGVAACFRGTSLDADQASQAARILWDFKRQRTERSARGTTPGATPTEPSYDPDIPEAGNAALAGYPDIRTPVANRFIDLLLAPRQQRILEFVFEQVGDNFQAGYALQQFRKDLLDARRRFHRHEASALDQMLVYSTANAVLIFLHALKVSIRSSGLQQDVVTGAVVEIKDPHDFQSVEIALAIESYLTRYNYQQLLVCLERLFNRPVSMDEVESVRGSQVKAGRVEEIYKVDVQLRSSEERSFAMVAAINPQSVQTNRSNYENMQFLYGLDSRFLPQPFGNGWGSIMRAVQPARTSLFSSEWLSGYEELHVRADFDPQRIIVSRGHVERSEYLSLAESREVIRRFARMLAVYALNPRTAVLGGFSMNAGDLVVKRLPDGDLSVKLITVRFMVERPLLLVVMLEHLIQSLVVITWQWTPDERFYLSALCHPAAALQGLYDGFMETANNSLEVQQMIRRLIPLAKYQLEESDSPYWTTVGASYRPEDVRTVFDIVRQRVLPVLTYYENPHHWNDNGIEPYPRQEEDDGLHASA